LLFFALDLQATKALSSQFFADANCIPALVHIIQASPQKEVRLAIVSILG
jgi:hypothetical protein